MTVTVPNDRISIAIAKSEMAASAAACKVDMDSVEFEHAAIVPRTIHAAAFALCQLFPHWECTEDTDNNAAVNSSDENLDAFVIVETILEIEHNDSTRMLAEMDSLVPFSPDAPFRSSLATFIVNLCMLKADVKSQDLIPTDVLLRMVYRLNRLLHSRGHIDATLVDCEHLLARAQEDIALGA